MTKTMIVPISYQNIESISGAPSYFEVTLTPLLVETIESLSELVANNKLYCLEAFNSSGEWLCEDKDTYSGVCSLGTVKVFRSGDFQFTAELTTESGDCVTIYSNRMNLKN